MWKRETFKFLFFILVWMSRAGGLLLLLWFFSTGMRYRLNAAGVQVDYLTFEVVSYFWLITLPVFFLVELIRGGATQKSFTRFLKYFAIVSVATTVTFLATVIVTMFVSGLIMGVLLALGVWFNPYLLMFMVALIIMWSVQGFLRLQGIKVG